MPARDRSKHVLVVMATLMGLWFGVSAPSISPVAATTTVTTQQTPIAPQQPADLRGDDGR